MLREVLRSLWPVLAALYVLEGGAWVRPGHWLFVTTLGAPWRRSFRRRGPGLHLACLLPGSRRIRACEPLVVASREGVAVATQPLATAVLRWEREAFTHLPWEGLGSLDREAHRLHLAPGLSVAFPSPAHAEHCRASLARAATVAAAKRRGFLTAELAASFDLARLQARRRQIADRPSGLPALAWLLFILGFVALPVVAYVPPVASVAWLARPPVAAVALLTLLTHLLAGSALALDVRRLRSQGVPQGRSLLFEVLLSPPAMVHAASRLGEDAYPDFDALAVAAALLPPALFAPLARRELHRLEAALEREEDASWREVLAERRRLVRTLVGARGLDLAAVVAPPPRQDARAAAYCPLCDAELHAPGICPDCGLPLRVFPAEEEANML